MTTDTSSEGETGVALSVASIRVDPRQLPAGQDSAATGLITLTGAAPAEGADVQVFTDHPEVVTVPEVVRVPASQSTQTFPISVQSAADHVAADITAFIGDEDKKNDTLLIGTPAQAAMTNGHEHVAVGSLTAAAPAAQPQPTAPPRPTDNAAPAQVTPPAEPAAPAAPSPALDLGAVQLPAAFPHCGHSFRAALVAALPTIPFAGVVATLAIYGAPAGSVLARLDPVLAGAAVALIFGVLVAVIYRWVLRGTSADQVNSSIFNELRDRLGQIVALGSVAVAKDDAAQVAARQLQDGVRLMTGELQEGGPDWIMGMGYISAWKIPT